MIGSFICFEGGTGFLIVIDLLPIRFITFLEETASSIFSGICPSCKIFLVDIEVFDRGSASYGADLSDKRGGSAKPKNLSS